MSQLHDNTVDQLYHAANDVDMQDAFPVAHQSVLYVVVDTNVLIDYCGVVEQFCADTEEARYPIVIIIPSVVLGELDGLKNRPELQWFARQASTWLLKKVKERTTVKLQAAKETQSPGGARTESDEIRKNDLAIRDCCLHFARRGFGAVMVTMDKNLALECIKEGLETCTPPVRKWSSRQFAQSLPVPGVDASLFRDREALPRYRPSRRGGERLAQTEGPAPGTRLAIADDDMMDVDDGEVRGSGMPEEYVPLHARDSLHAQMAEHFTQVLKDLACRVRRESGDEEAVSRSAHAPAYRRVAPSAWTAGVCLEYLQTKRREVTANFPNWLGSFFASRGGHGWRKGQDWSPAMWNVALDVLESVGNRFGDGAMVASVSAVRPHVREVWEAKLRPV